MWLAEVKTARKNIVEFAVIEELPANTELPEATLYLALIKFERFEWAVEKATELAVARIVPVEASRSERGLAEGARKRVERWRRIAREAGEQSRRLRPPEVKDPIGFDRMLAAETTHRIWLDERPGAPSLLSALTPSATVAFAIGPEGGWSDAERHAFDKASWTPASLGPAILRAETAVTATLAVWLQTQLEMRVSGALPTP